MIVLGHSEFDVLAMLAEHVVETVVGGVAVWIVVVIHGRCHGGNVLLVTDHRIARIGVHVAKGNVVAGEQRSKGKGVALIHNRIKALHAHIWQWM